MMLVVKARIVDEKIERAPTGAEYLQKAVARARDSPAPARLAFVSRRVFRHASIQAADD